MKNPGQFVVEDLPFDEHTVIVNRGRCNETRLVDLRYNFGVQQSYKIVLNDLQPRAGARGGTARPMELRVRDGEKRTAKGTIVGHRGTVTPVDDYGLRFTAFRQQRRASTRIAARITASLARETKRIRGPLQISYD